MAFLRLLTSVSMLAGAIAFSEWDNITDIDYRLPENVVPVHYDVKLIPHIEEGNLTFDGESSTIVEIRQRATRELKLHILDLTIDKTATTLIGSNDSYTPTSHKYDSVTQILTLIFDNELLPDVYTLRMKFAGVLNDTPYGFYVTSYINEEGREVWLASTCFETTWARHAFPCWDEPALKATFNISVKHNRNYTALSNMPIREETEDGNEDDVIWTHFEKTPIMSTYLVAFVVSDYVRIPNEDRTVNMWCRSAVTPYVKYSQEVAARAKQLLTEYTNITYKLPKLDLAAIPKLASSAMENWGLIICRELSLSYNEESDTVHQKHVVSKTVAHEMAHQWFGNLVSPLWWSDVWLSEGFSSFFAYYILNQMFEDRRIMEHFVVLIQHNALKSDSTEYTNPVTYEVERSEEITSLFGSNIYEKAPCILRMIQNIITEDVFRKGVIKYLHAHQFGSATADDLWNAFQEVLDESDVSHDDYRVKEVMDTWIKTSHYPVVHVTLSYKIGEVMVTQERFRSQRKFNKHVDDDKWWIPITFATRSNPDFSATVPTLWLRPQDHYVPLNGIDSNDWIIVNLQSMGFYRVNYDLYNWLKILNYLNSDDYVKIHVLNRAQLVDDAYHFMLARQLEVVTFLNLITYYERETDFIAWRPMFALFESNAQVFKFPQTSCLQRLFTKLLNNLVESTGYDEDPDDDDFTKLNRMSVLQWACTFGHTKCKTMATVKLSEHLADPETHKVSPNLKDWMFCNGLAGANVSTWNKFRETYVKNSDMILLRYLTCAEDPDILINFLNASLSNNSVSNNDYKIIYSSIVRRHANNDSVLDYLLANVNKTIPRGYTLKGILRGIIYSTYSTKRLEKITNFVKTNFGNEIFETIESMLYDHKTDLRLTWSVIVDTFRPACNLIV